MPISYICLIISSIIILISIPLIIIKYFSRHKMNSEPDKNESQSQEIELQDKNPDNEIKKD